MTDIFISYSREDNQDGFVTNLVRSLETKGLDIWFDEDDIPKGSIFWNQIREGIDSSNVFVLIVSRNSLNSLACHEEIEYARKGKLIISFIYEPIDEVTLLS